MSDTSTTPITTRLLTSRDVANRLGYSVGTIANWRGQGKGPNWIKVGRSVRYPEAWLESWIGDQKAVSNSTRMED